MSNIAPLFAIVIPLLIMPLFTGYAIKLPQIPIGTRWWFGIIACGSLVMIGHAIHLAYQITFLILLLAVTLAGLSVISRLDANKLTGRNSQIKSDWFYSFLPVSLLVLFIGASLIHILAVPLNMHYQDAFDIWYYKAKGLFFWIPFAELPEPNNSKVLYPHLGPVLEMIIMKFGGTPSVAYGRLLFPTAYLFWILSFRMLYPKNSAAIHVWILLFLAIVSFQKTPFTNGYQDGFLALCAGMATLHFVYIFMHYDHIQESQNRSVFYCHLFLSYFFAGSICFIKNEGAVLALIIVIAATAIFLTLKVMSHAAISWRPLVPFGLMFLGMVFLWPTLLRLNNLDPARFMGDTYSTSSIVFWFRNMDRWPVISEYVVKYIGSTWAFILTCSLLSIVSFIWTPKLRLALVFLWLIYLGHVSFVPIAFFATQEPLTWHLDTAFDRLMSQHFFIYTTILALAIFHLIQNPKLSEEVKS